VATHETTIHLFPAQERVAQTIPFVDRVLSIVDHPQLTTCYWADVFCDCRELGTIHCLDVMRLAETPSPAFAPGLKKPAASVGLDEQARRGLGD
jgi:hypothetical protein